MVEELVAGEAEQRTDHGAEGIHRPVEAENTPAGRVVDALDEQRVSRRSANPLAEPVDHPACQHTGPCRRRRDDDLAERRHAIPGRDQRTARVAIREGSRRQLGQRRRPLRNASTAPTTAAGAPNTVVR